MNYKNLVTLLSKQSQKSERETRQELAHTISVVTDLLGSGKKVTIPGLGTFNVKMAEERKMYSPHHKDYIMAPPKRSVEFSPSSLLKEKLKKIKPEDE